MEKSKNSFIAIGLMLFALFFGAGNLISRYSWGRIQVWKRFPLQSAF